MPFRPPAHASIGRTVACTCRALGVAAALAAGVTASALDTAAAPIKLVPVLAGLSGPIFVTSARDGSQRLFVVEQAGIIKVLQPGQTAPTVFLDITTRVLAGGERGLLGLAFHPQFASNRRFFVNYTRQTDGATVVAAYGASEANPNVADPAETVLLVIAQPFANHNGGMLAFGPDGFLYIATGDGGSANDPGNRGQDVDQRLGKILRIDVDQPNGTQPYSSPPGNPFSGATAGADEIFAWGLRNPWRFAFDRGTGALYAGDVGQNAVEEIDVITLGGNYGWRIWEGTHCTGNDPALCDPAGFVFPIVEYAHQGGRCSVTGGYVYRGPLASLAAGSYVYGDFCTGEIFLLAAGASSIALDTALNISSFGEDEAGEVYVVGLGGTVHRIASLATGGDFEGNGTADILWRHSSGGVGLWFMTGTAIAGVASAGGLSPDWTIAGVGDFNGDGKADILWRHISGGVTAWLMNGAAVIAAASVGGASTDWTIAGVGDFDGDGKADILWRHTSGGVGIWFMNGTSTAGVGSAGGIATDWTIAGVGDFNGDGKADILWRHTSGGVTVWLMNGAVVTSIGSAGGAPSGWTIADVGDFNGDGKADILWRHTSGGVGLWFMSGAAVVAVGSVGGLSSDWTIAAVGDLNTDGKADIIWRHTSGRVSVWLLDGARVIGTGTPGDAAPEWQIRS